MFIVGAGVIGLSAIQTAKCLGAQVRAFDSRNSTKEQIQSLGVEFTTINVSEDSMGLCIKI